LDKPITAGTLKNFYLGVDENKKLEAFIKVHSHHTSKSKTISKASVQQYCNEVYPHSEAGIKICQIRQN
jgi:hypothetical protein